MLQNLPIMKQILLSRISAATGRSKKVYKNALALSRIMEYK